MKHSKLIDLRRKFFCYKFLFLELLGSRIDYFQKRLTNYRKKVISEEIKNVNLSSDDATLFIGCGLLPSTPLFIAENTDVKKISAIDNNRQIAKFAKSYIDKKGLSSRINVEHADGVDYPVEEFDVIFMATNVWPAESILKNLAANMKNNSKLICRDIKNDINGILEIEGLYDKFYVESFSEHPAGPEYKSLILVKK